jgi:hypothetical protein
MINHGRTAGVIVLIFSLCAVADFILGYFRERTISAGVISVVGGLFGTAFFLLITQPRGKTKTNLIQLAARSSAVIVERLSSHHLARKEIAGDIRYGSLLRTILQLLGGHGIDSRV